MFKSNIYQNIFKTKDRHYCIKYTLTSCLSESRILEIVELGSSYSCGCSNGLPVFLINQAAKDVNK
jgi:hypothetical protein